MSKKIYGCEECGYADDGLCLNCGKFMEKGHQSQCDDNGHSHLNCKYPTLLPRELWEKGYGEKQEKQ